MAYTTIDDPSAYFHTRLYTGNGSTQSITNNANAGDFPPDWVWIKGRSDADNNSVFDTTRGANEELVTNGTGAEATGTNLVTSFDSNGFSLGNNAGVNGSGDTYVAWQWIANSGTTSSNTNGSITSTVQANTTAGFSIVTYTGNGSDNATVGHGLGVKPKVIIPKRRDSSGHWLINDWSGDYANKLKLNDTEASSSSDSFVKDASSTTFTLGTDVDVNASSGTYIAYCFAEKQGYSKFGSYTGNGSADGPMVFCGLKPAWVMTKRTDSSTNGDWAIYDNKRSASGGGNENNKNLRANDSIAEASNTGIDILSNGFKIRSTSTRHNASGGTYIYMCFASSPFVSSEGVPTTAF